MPRIHCREIAVLVALLASSPTVQGQLPDTSYAARALTALAARLHADTTLPDSFRLLTPAALARTMDTGHFDVLLDDPSTSLYVRTMAATLHQIPDSLCGQLLMSTEDVFSEAVILFPHVDSSTMDNWTVVFERIVRARARSDSGGRVASFQELQATMRNIIGGFSDADRDRMMQIALHPPPTPDDMCWSARKLTDGLADLTPEELGPVSRAMGRGDFVSRE